MVGFMNKKNELVLVSTGNGKAVMSSCGCCVKISFKNLVCRFKTDFLKNFISYINSLNSGMYDHLNEEEGKTLISLKDHNFMIAFDDEELDEFANFLNKTQIELKRVLFEKIYSSVNVE